MSVKIQNIFRMGQGKALIQGIGSMFHRQTYMMINFQQCLLYAYVTQQTISHVKMAGVGFCAIFLFRNDCLFEHCYWSFLWIQNFCFQNWICCNLPTSLVAAFVFASQKGEHMVQSSWISPTNRILRRSINTAVLFVAYRDL